MPNIPSVKIYIRRSGTRRYEGVKTRNPQACGEGDVYCLHLWHNRRRQWITVGTDYREALQQQFETQNQFMREGRTASDPVEKPRTLREWQKEFLEFKRTTTKKDGTPLDGETITAYHQQTDEFLGICKATVPMDITGQDLRRYMAALRQRGLSHRSVCNNYTSIATFLKFGGVDHKELLPYGERPAPDDPIVEPYEDADLRKFFAALHDERHRLYFEFLLKIGPREREGTTLEWTDLDLCKEPSVTFRARKPHLKFRVKTGKGRTVPLERNLALKLAAWRVKNPGRKLVFGTKSDLEDSHFFRTAVEGFERAGLPTPRRPLHRFRDTAATAWLRAGVDLRTVSAWLGHSSVTQTEKYLSPVKGERAQQLINRVYLVDPTQPELTAAVQ